MRAERNRAIAGDQGGLVVRIEAPAGHGQEQRDEDRGQQPARTYGGRVVTATELHDIYYSLS